jgi:hypothetical protein
MGVMDGRNGALAGNLSDQKHAGHVRRVGLGQRDCGVCSNRR